MKLKVATFNVGHFNQGMRGGLELKGLNDEIFKKDYANMHLLNWRNWIANQSIDLFGFNEWNYYFDEDSLFNAEENLLQPFYNNIYWGEEHSYIYNGIATNYKLTNIRTKYWAGDYYAIMGDLIINETVITIISTHIPWQKQWHLKALSDLVIELKKYKYVICMGDMNSSDDEQIKLIDEGFNIANGGNQGWFATGRKKPILNRMIDMPDRHIDNIITSENIKIMNINAPLSYLNDFDHLPIIADLIITFD